MNKQLYKVIFNKKRGDYMVVAENASVCSNGHYVVSEGQASESMPFYAALRSLSFSLMLALGAVFIAPSMAYSQIIADHNRPKAPTVLPSGNGTPQVNIQTPNADGVSMNHYQQFDVNDAGVILNNSRGNTQTQLGGWIQGNPWLARGEANVIVNQINSSNPSHLNGYIEIAGRKADMIIANPAGIQVDGAGFINTHRAVLTTGDLIMNGGTIDGYSVSRGKITIQGAGLDARGADYTQLLTTAAEINAQVFGDNLEVIAGHYDLEDGDIRRHNGNYGDGYAIDTSELGGMYANKIHLISTDRDRMINHEGETYASAGGVVINADGTITNSGIIHNNATTTAKPKQADANVTIRAPKVVNRGTISSKQHLNIDLDHLINQGLITADRELIMNAMTVAQTKGANLNAGRIAITADQLTNEGGTITQVGLQDFAITADYFTNSESAHLGYKIVDSSESNNPPNNDENLNVPGYKPENGSTVTNNLVANENGNSSESNNEHSDNYIPLFFEEGMMNITTIVNQSGDIYGNGAINLTVHKSLINSDSSLNINRLDLSGDHFSNAKGKLYLNNLNANVTDFDNQAGEIQVKESIIINSAQLSNQLGYLVAGHDINLSITDLFNKEGRIESHQKIDLVATQLDNQLGIINANGVTIDLENVSNIEGSILSNDSLTLNAKDLINIKGQIEATKDLSMTVSNINNTEGLLLSANNIQLDTYSLINHAGIINAKNIMIDSDQMDNSHKGEIGAQQTLNIHANQLNNQEGSLLANDETRLSAKFIDNRNNGLIASLDQLTLTGDDFSNQKGSISGDKINLNFNDIDNQQGIIGSTDTLTINANNLNNQKGSLVAENELLLNLANLLNDQGMIASNHQLTLKSPQISNYEGKILSGQMLELTGDTLINQKGLIEANDANITFKRLDNSQKGMIHVNDHLALQIDQHLDNRHGEITSVETMSIYSLNQNTLHIDNREGDILAGKTLDINAYYLSGDGVLASGGDLSLDLFDDLDNRSKIQAGDQLLLNTSGDLLNSGDITSGNGSKIVAKKVTNEATGSLEAENSIIIDAATEIINRGVINSNGLTLLKSKDRLINRGTGKIYGDHIALETTQLINNHEIINGEKKSGTIAARERLDIGAQQILNEEGALLFSGNSMVLGGSLNDQYLAEGKAKLIENKSATIESLGDMKISTNQLLNSNEYFVIGRKQVGEKDIVLITPEGDAKKYDEGLFTWEKWKKAGRYRWNNSKPINGAGIVGKTPIAAVNAGYCEDLDDFSSCTTIKGAEYLSDNPAWDYFNIDPPENAPETLTAIEPIEPTVEVPIEPEEPSGGCDGLTSSICTQYQKELAIYEVDKRAYDDALATYDDEKAKYDQIKANYEAEVLAWQEKNDPKFEALDEAIYLYNQSFGAGEVRNFTKYTIKRKEYEDYIVSSDPGKILVGGNLELDSHDVTNDKSHIIVGRTLIGNADNIKNIDDEGLHVTYDVGISQYSKARWRGGFRRYHQRDYGAVLAYKDEKQEQITLQASEVKQNTKLKSNNLDEMGHQFTRQSDITANGSSYDGHQLENQDHVNQYDIDQREISIYSVEINTNLPSSSLYMINPKSGDYLIETDPRFTNYRAWLGSDYLLGMMDANSTLKRLGDGFYEQRLVNDQIAQLTGHRYLGAHQDDEEQFKALMTDGATFAQELQLTPGTKLTKEMVAQLTTDIVWLETESITLADGTTTDVLVPKVYLMIQEGDLNAAGALIAGQDLQLDVTENLYTSGTIAGRNITSLSAKNIDNIAGDIKGRSVSLMAEQDISIKGGTVNAKDQMLLEAGNDVNVESLTYTTEVSGQGFTGSRTGIDRMAGLYVKSDDGILMIDSGHDININAALVQNSGKEGETLFKAGNNISLGTVTVKHSESAIQDAKNYRNLAQTEDVGSTIDVAGKVSMLAEGEVTLTAANVNSQKDVVAISGKKGVVIEAGQSTQEFSEGHYQKHSGMLGSSSREVAYTDNYQESLGSTVTGHEIAIQSGKDALVSGSQVVADSNLTIQAENDVIVTADKNYYDSSQYSETTRSGIMSSGGLGVTIGKRENENKNQSQSVIHTGSMVGSLDGEVNLQAGNEYRQEGSEVSTGGIGNDIHIQAKKVLVTDVEDTMDQESYSRFKQTGITVSVGGSAALNLVDNALSYRDTIDRVGKSKNSRVNAMSTINAAAKGALMGLNLKDDLKEIPVDGNALTSNGSVSISLGSSQSKSESEYHETTSSGSLIHGSGKVNISALGGGKDSNIHIRGSDVLGEQGSQFNFEGDMIVEAGVSTTEEHSKNKSSGFNVGISLGKNTGYTIGGNLGKGKGDGTSVTYNHSHIGKSGSETIFNPINGGDLTIHGGQIFGNVKTKEGTKLGNLTITTPQDSSTYKSKQKDISASITVGPSFSGSASFGKSNINASHLSPGEISGIFADDEGYQLGVSGHTQLNGGVITSTTQAEAEGKNQLITGTIDSQNLINHSQYEGKSVGISTSGGLKNSNPFAGKSAGYGKDSDSQGSVTVGGVNTQNIIITDAEKQQALTGKTVEETIRDLNKTPITTDNFEDGSVTGVLENRFDAGEVQRELDLQVAVTKEFDEVRQAGKQIINEKIDQYKKTDPQKAKDWQNVGLIVDMVSGGLYNPSESLGGSLVNAINPLVVKIIGDHFKDKNREGEADHLISQAVWGAIVAQAGGNDPLAGAINTGGMELAIDMIAQGLYPDTEKEDLTAQQKKTISAIAGGLGLVVGGVVGDSSENAIMGGAQGQIVVEDNQFWRSKTPEEKEKEREEKERKNQERKQKREKEQRDREEYNELVSNSIINDPESTEEEKNKAYNCLADKMSPVCAQLKGGTSNLTVGLERVEVYIDGLRVTVEVVGSGAFLGAGIVTAPYKIIDKGGKFYAVYKGKRGKNIAVEISKADRMLPVPTHVKGKNGLIYKSNPKHTPGSSGFGGARAGIEPKNSFELFEKSIFPKSGNQKARFTIDGKGDIHQFMPDNIGGFHWAGSTADKKNPLKLDNRVKSVLRKEFGWKIK